MSEAAARKLYTALWWLGLPVVALYLLWRSLRQREYRNHWAERFLGRGARFDSPGEVIWVHAVSVGETRAAQPLIEALAAGRPAARFVLTHMTPTGRAVGDGIARSLPGRVLQRYLPYELPFAQRRFMREIEPALGVLMETEIWPNLLAAARAHGVPMALANARLSEKSQARGLRIAPLMRAAARGVTRVAAQSEDDRRRFAVFFRGPIDVVGNLKFDIAPPPDLIETGRRLRAVAGRPVWLFASTREGEEQRLLDAIEKWGQTPFSAQAPSLGRKRVSDPIFLFVPRHPQRFDEVARLIETAGRPVLRRSQGAELAEVPERGVYLGDSMGELPLFYAAADVAFVGGSLLPFGAHNLIEACACGCPVVIGPSTFNFAQAVRDAVQAKAAVQVDDAAAVLATLDALCSEPQRLAAMRDAALAFAQAHRGATARTVEMLNDLLTASAAR